MKATEPRLITKEEAAVISAALLRAPLGEPSEAAQGSIASLSVVGKCDCGCDSLFFVGSNDASQEFRIADGLGYTADGEEIGIIVWASGSQVVHLELYNYSDQPARLPIAESVCSFEQSRRTKE